MTPPQHLWFFTRESMRRMAAPLGLYDGDLRSPWKYRAALADRLPGRAACSACESGRRRPRAGSAFRSICSTPCASCCARQTHVHYERSRLTLSQIPLLVAYAAGMPGASSCSRWRAALRARRRDPCGAALRLVAQRAIFSSPCALRRARRAVGLDPDLHAAVARLSVRRARLRAHAGARRALFAEPLSARLVIGIALILCGLVFVAG